MQRQSRRGQGTFGGARHDPRASVPSAAAPGARVAVARRAGVPVGLCPTRVSRTDTGPRRGGLRLGAHRGQREDGECISERRHGGLGGRERGRERVVGPAFGANETAPTERAGPPRRTMRGTPYLGNIVRSASSQRKLQHGT